MTESQTLAVQLSETRSRLAELAAISDRELTEDETAEVRKRAAEVSQLETRRQAALAAEEPVEETETDNADGEARERAALEGRARLGEYVRAAIAQRPAAGAEGELAAAYGLSGGQVPLAAIAPRERAVATVPAQGQREQMQDTILGRIFAGSAVEYLGIQTPQVASGDASYPVLTAGPKPAFVAASAAAASSPTAAISATVLTPVRVSASLEFTRESEAQMPGLEDALRMDLSDALADAMAELVINGNSAPSVTGALAAVTAPSDPSAVATFLAAVQGYGGAVDGKYASMLQDLRVLCSPEAYALAVATFPGSTLQSAPALSAYSESILGGFRASDHIDDTSTGATAGSGSPVTGQIHPLLVRRGPFERRAAVMPVWDASTLIVDPYSRAQQGEIRLTLVGLANFAVVDSASFSMLKWQLN